MMLTLEFIIEALSEQYIEGAHPITDVVIDSREVTVGALFVALPGEKADGHEYVGQALERGAIAAIIDREVEVSCPVIDLTSRSTLQFGEGGAVREPPLQTPVCLKVENALLALQGAARQWMRRLGTRVVGITGSVGKTTTKEAVAGVLAQKYTTLKNEGSLNNEIGLPLTALHLTAQHERAVLEMGFYVPGEIALLCGIAPPQVGVVTLIAPVHLERAKSVEAIIRGKSELLEALPPEGVAVLNLDDANVMKMAASTQARLLTYGLNPQADVWAGQVEGLGLDGVCCVLHHGGESRPVHLKLLGRHSVYPALAAAAVGLAEGLTWEEIVVGLEGLSGGLRLVTVPGPRGSTILDDTYNASPPSTIAALNLLADLREVRHVAVLGDMLELGDYEDEGHRKVGRRAAEVADLLVTVGERGRIIAQEALHGGMIQPNICVAASAEEAIAFLREAIQPGDAVLVKGSRAVKMERIVEALREAAETEDRNPAVDP